MTTASDAIPHNPPFDGTRTPIEYETEIRWLRERLNVARRVVAAARPFQGPEEPTPEQARALVYAGLAYSDAEGMNPDRWVNTRGERVRP